MPKVLLVDDEPNVRWTTAELLKREGFETLTAADFDSALAMARDHEFDAALVDIILPRRSGIELLKEFAKKGSYLPVVMMTGEPSLTDLPEIVRAGAYDFLSKPLVKEVLIQTVTNAVENKRLVDEKRGLERQVKMHAEQLETMVAERTRELADAQARLAHNEKIAALGRAAAQVAHEVKNPLTGLRLFALHLKKKAADKLADDEMSLLDKVIDGIDHLSSTVEKVLDFARPINLARRPSDLNRIVANAVEVLEPQIAAGGIQVRLPESHGAMTGMFDEGSLRSAFINLMLNAVEAMPDGGQMTVATDRRESALYMTVSDTGRGMSAEEIKKVFEPFHSTKGSGLGLGMSYAKKIIDEHGGAIVVTSRPGHGTTVEITLPTEVEKS